MHHLKNAAHVLIFVFSVHVWHMLGSDRMLDAFADVGLDKVADIVLVASHISEK
jgi:hypothetical protein